jgi:hypothetical protein
MHKIENDFSHLNSQVSVVQTAWRARLIDWMLNSQEVTPLQMCRKSKGLRISVSL